MRALLLTLISGFILTTSTISYAGGNDEEAKAAFDFGKAWFNEGKYKEAADAFRQAYELRPSWKIFYNIGQSEAAATRHDLALEAFEKYLSQGGDNIPTDRQDEVRAEIKRLYYLVGYVEVDAPDGSVVIIDEIERGRIPLSRPIAVTADVDHRVVIKNNRTELANRRIHIGRDKTTRITIEKSQGVNVLRLAGWATAGLGGALLVTGAITGGKVVSLNKSLEGVCPDSECPPEYWGYVDKIHNLCIATDVMLVIGSAALATGAGILIFSYRKGEIAALPVAGSDFIGASIQGRF